MSDYLQFKCYIKFNMTCTICEISQIQYARILVWVVNIMYLTTKDGQYDWNM